MKKLVFVFSLLLLLGSCNDVDDPTMPLTREETISCLSKKWMMDETTGYKSFQFNAKGEFVVEKFKSGSTSEIEFFQALIHWKMI